MYHIVGKEVRRVDGYEKVTGKAKYGDDLKFSGMLFAACRYTDIPAGKITEIDVSAAEKISGLEAIALYKDVPGQKRVGPIRADQFPIVKDEVFYSGDVLAVVAANSKEAAYEAVNSIKAKYDEIPFALKNR